MSHWRFEHESIRCVSFQTSDWIIDARRSRGEPAPWFWRETSWSSPPSWAFSWCSARTTTSVGSSGKARRRVWTLFPRCSAAMILLPQFVLLWHYCFYLYCRPLIDAGNQCNNFVKFRWVWPQIDVLLCPFISRSMNSGGRTETLVTSDCFSAAWCFSEIGSFSQLVFTDVFLLPAFCFSFLFSLFICSRFLSQPIIVLKWHRRLKLILLIWMILLFCFYCVAMRSASWETQTFPTNFLLTTYGEKRSVTVYQLTINMQMKRRSCLF